MSTKGRIILAGGRRLLSSGLRKLLLGSGNPHDGCCFIQASGCGDIGPVDVWVSADEASSELTNEVFQLKSGGPCLRIPKTAALAMCHPGTVYMLTDFDLREGCADPACSGEPPPDDPSCIRCGRCCFTGNSKVKITIDPPEEVFAWNWNDGNPVWDIPVSGWDGGDPNMWPSALELSNAGLGTAAWKKTVTIGGQDYNFSAGYDCTRDAWRVSSDGPATPWDDVNRKYAGTQDETPGGLLAGGCMGGEGDIEGLYDDQWYWPYALGLHGQMHVKIEVTSNGCCKRADGSCQQGTPDGAGACEENELP